MAQVRVPCARARSGLAVHLLRLLQGRQLVHPGGRQHVEAGGTSRVAAPAGRRRPGRRCRGRGPARRRASILKSPARPLVAAGPQPHRGGRQPVPVEPGLGVGPAELGTAGEVDDVVHLRPAPPPRGGPRRGPGRPAPPRRTPPSPWAGLARGGAGAGRRPGPRPGRPPRACAPPQSARCRVVEPRVPGGRAARAGWSSPVETTRVISTSSMTRSDPGGRAAVETTPVISTSSMTRRTLDDPTRRS